MGRSSLRGWLLLVSVLFAVLVVSGIALTSYVIVSDGMRTVAADTTQRMANASVTLLEDVTTRIERDLAEGDDGSDVAERQQFLAELSQVFGGYEQLSVAHALYDSELRLLWANGALPPAPGAPAARAVAVDTGSPTSSEYRGDGALAGLVSQARLGATVVHAPVLLPGGEIGVLDIAYLPRSEERVIDAVRVPMLILALSSILIMAVLVQTSMSWVLHLVDNLRRAADSITAGRLDERLPESSANEIGQLAVSINRLIDRLDRRAEAQSRFVADASHELATPVAGIRGYTNILRAWGGEDAAVRAEAIDAIDRESRRMARLTGDLLNLLHADQNLRLRTERFDLNELIRERLVTSAERWIEKDINFVGPGEQQQTMVGDPDRVDDVLSILLDNAGKYTPDGGRVAVTTHRARERVTIRVADTGSGIPPEDLPRVFDRFFRSEAARAAGEGGFGLGLAIAKSIVESMNGSISVESTPATGTTFTVVLPRGRL